MMATFSMVTEGGEARVSRTKEGVTMLVNTRDNPTVYFSMKPEEARAHAQHLIAVAAEIEAERER